MSPSEPLSDAKLAEFDETYVSPPGYCCAGYCVPSRNLHNAERDNAYNTFATYGHSAIHDLLAEVRRLRKETAWTDAHTEARRKLDKAIREFISVVKT